MSGYQNLNIKELRIIEDTKIASDKEMKDNSDIAMFSNHSANLIKDWQESQEYEVWK